MNYYKKVQLLLEVLSAKLLLLIFVSHRSDKYKRAASSCTSIPYSLTSIDFCISKNVPL